MAFTLAVQFQDYRQTRAFLRHESITVSNTEEADWNLPELEGAFSLIRQDDSYRLIAEFSPLKFNGQDLSLGQSVELHHNSEFSLGEHEFRFELKQRDLQVRQKKGALALIAKIMVASIFFIEVFVVFILPKQVTQSQLFKRNITLQKSSQVLDTLRRDSSQYSQLYKKASPTMRSLIVMIKDDLDSQAWLIRRQSENLTLSEVNTIFHKLTSYQESLKYLRTHSFDHTKTLKNEDIMSGLQQYYDKI